MKLINKIARVRAKWLTCCLLSIRHMPIYLKNSLNRNESVETKIKGQRKLCIKSDIYLLIFIQCVLVGDEFWSSA